MKREKSGALSWLDTASGKVRFPPDRKAVREELRAHLEDKADDLQRIYPDLSRGEAERMAIEQMGDAGEIGDALAALHHPLLGYLWYGARAALVLALLFTVLFVCLQPRFINDLQDGNWETERLEIRYKGAEELGSWTAPDPVELDHYILEVPAAARMEESWQLESTGERIGCQSGAIRLRLTAKRFWNRPEGENLGLERGLTAVDEFGKKISFPRLEPRDSWEYFVLRDEVPFTPGEQGWSWQEYELLARNITPGARWVELGLKLEEEEFTLRVDLPEQVTFSSGHGSVEGELPWF